MNYFSLDTSTRAGSMAVAQNGAIASAVQQDPRSHAERLPLEAIEWLRASGTDLRDIDTFVVIAGPGSFTGLRVGLACVQGWAFARRRPVVAVPSLDALAFGVVARPDVVVAPMIDGQRGEVFFSAWANGREVVAAAVGAPEVGARALQAMSEGREIVAAGDGAERYADALGATGITVVKATTNLADLALQLAMAGRYPAAPAAAARPIYVRRTDAEVARDRREDRV